MLSIEPGALPVPREVAAAIEARIREASEASMLSVKTPHQQMAAVLHDVVEDTPVTLEDLKAQGFPQEVLEAVEALTKKQGETRLEAARRAAQNPIARVVKLTDVADNLDLGRISNPSEKDYARLKEYAQVKELLEEDSL